jgi:hypothetical protein
MPLGTFDPTHATIRRMGSVVRNELGELEISDWFIDTTNWLIGSRTPFVFHRDFARSEIGGYTLAELKAAGADIRV